VELKSGDVTKVPLNLQGEPPKTALIEPFMVILASSEKFLNPCGEPGVVGALLKRDRVLAGTSRMRSAPTVLFFRFVAAWRRPCRQKKTQSYDDCVL